MKKLKISKLILVLLPLALVAGCVTSKKMKNIAVLPDQGPVEIVLRPTVGQGDRTEYRSRTLTETFSNGEITRKISEGVDFIVDTKVTHVDSANGVGTYDLTTVSKEGNIDLSDFAMPELNETLQYVLTKDGRVVRAGDMPVGTIYYVPPVSLPKGEVSVGDSWSMKAEWISVKSGIPLRMEVVSILKNIRDCGAAGRCAEIELSGDVTIVGASKNVLSSNGKNDKDLLMRFRSDIQGQILLSLNKGSVLHSIIRSEESLFGVKDTVRIKSCMLTYVTEPKEEHVMAEKSAECDPLSDVLLF
ncbi:MAG: hypothetical protein KDD38_01445 [Bdellovibrionales bacterium]|nr:hypothetical protein [Bdellovibrionales bacterium]